MGVVLSSFVGVVCSIVCCVVHVRGDYYFKINFFKKF